MAETVHLYNVGPPVATRLRFQVASRTITGNLGPNFFHCMMWPAQGGTLPPAGDYEIVPQASQPAYGWGRFALMTAVAGDYAGKGTHIPEKGTHIPEKGTHIPERSRFDFTAKQKPDGSKQKPDGIRQKPDGTAAGDFVLSDRPVWGQNCIVVSFGFDGLMDALQTAGGARATVA